MTPAGGSAGPERPSERGAGPERPSERGAGPAGTRFTDVRRYVEVDSTNRVAADLVRSGATEGLVVVAEHQTAGRGRRGRSWEAPPRSSLLVSVVLGPPAEGAPLTTVACAIAAADACADVAGFDPGLKWPNDLVVDGRKLAGVLGEGAAGGAVVVGLGLNVRWPTPMPVGLATIAITAEAVAGGPIERQALLDAYLTRLEERCRDLADAGGRTAMMGDYRRRCFTLGRAVRIELPGDRVLSGTAVEVDEDGTLQVMTDGGIRRVTAGDVVHVR